MCNSSLETIHCNEKDRYALLSFKEGVLDPSNKLSSWSTQPDCCQWEGVECDNITSRVIHLSLPCFTATKLINHTASLTDSEYLVVDNFQWLSRVSSLEHLDLSGINLQKVTNWLQQLTTMLPSLSELCLHKCQLKDIYPSLEYANFTALQVLELSYNKFDSGLPKWLFNLTSHISYIDLGSNFLSAQLPKALPNFPNLEALLLHNNNLDGQIPDWFGQLKHLRKLSLRDNNFSGHIPISLGNASSLILLTIGSNPLTGVLSERNFVGLSKLESLGIQSKTLIFEFDSHWIPPFQLTHLIIGSVGHKIPNWIYTQGSIKGLTIFDFEVPFEDQDRFWSFASRMEVLHVEETLIDGDLSNVFLNSSMIWMASNDIKGGLPRLSSNVVVANMPNNSFSGSISPLFCDHNKMRNGKSNNLKYLDISNNRLTGGLTDCWNNWKSLVYINLGSNNLIGNIPQSMGLLSNLTSLHLHENKLFGEIPTSLKNCHSLLVLDVQENKLSGNIPNWIARSAKILQLRSNQFSGSIPPHMCQMSSLIILDFGDNKISGHIPKCLNNMTAMVLINNATISKLTFYFPFPDMYYSFYDDLELVTKGQASYYIKNLHFMSLVDLSSNELSGTIPPRMFSLIGLHSFNLSHNKLTGEIPKEIGNMKNLESVDVSTNKLYGEIPQSMSSLSFLSYINLSFNNFIGQIPSGTQLQGFTSLSNIRNPDLCGPPLTKSFSPDDRSKETKHKDKKSISEFMSWFYIGIESGFATGFLGVVVPFS